MNFNKEFYKSKTMWVALIIAVTSTLFPDAKEVISKHPDYVMGFVTFIFGLLRITTTKAIVVKKNKGITIKSVKKF